MSHTFFAYDTTDWLLFFYIYSFLGWVFESAYVSLIKGRPVNRGFLRGPFIPLYGSGALVMLFVSIPVESSPVLVYIAGCIGATALEYVTGVTMEHLFKVRYWDYSRQKFNFQGQICLSSTLAWGALTLLMVYVIHKPIENAVLALPYQAASVISHAVTAVFAVDATLSVKAALEVRSMLVTIEEVRKKLETMQRRADVILTFAQEDAKERLSQVRQQMSKYSLGLLRGNPSATSRYFQEALTELRERL